jgi:hypothetical protein
MSFPTDLFQEWRTANSQAFAAESECMRFSMELIDGVGEGPSEALRARARKLRAQADDLFVLAMAEMSLATEVLRRQLHT